MLNPEKVDELIASYGQKWSTKEELEALCKEEGVTGWFMLFNTVAERVGLVNNQSFIA
jgi:hypothetical protein